MAATAREIRFQDEAAGASGGRLRAARRTTSRSSTRAVQSGHVDRWASSATRAAPASAPSASSSIESR